MMSTSFVVRIAGPATACLLLGAIFSGESQAQSNAPAQQTPAKPRKLTQPAPPIPPTTVVLVPAAVPVTSPDSPLKNALSQQCSTGSDPTEFVVPGAKGDIKLDRCYRGRD